MSLNTNVKKINKTNLFVSILFQEEPESVDITKRQLEPNTMTGMTMYNGHFSPWNIFAQKRYLSV